MVLNAFLLIAIPVVVAVVLALLTCPLFNRRYASEAREKAAVQRLGSVCFVMWVVISITLDVMIGRSMWRDYDHSKSVMKIVLSLSPLGYNEQNKVDGSRIVARNAEALLPFAQYKGPYSCFLAMEGKRYGRDEKVFFEESRPGGGLLSASLIPSAVYSRQSDLVLLIREFDLGTYATGWVRNGIAQTNHYRSFGLTFVNTKTKTFSPTIIIPEDVEERHKTTLIYTPQDDMIRTILTIISGIG